MPLNINLKRSIKPVLVPAPGIELTSESLFTGKEHTMFLPITEADYYKWASGSSNEHVQTAFPHLSPDEREFLLSGVTSEEWDQEMSEDIDIDIDIDIINGEDSFNESLDSDDPDDLDEPLEAWYKD